MTVVKRMPYSPPSEGLEIIDLLLFGDREGLAAQGFKLEEKLGERIISRTVRLPDEETAGKSRRPDR